MDGHVSRYRGVSARATPACHALPIDRRSAIMPSCKPARSGCILTRGTIHRGSHLLAAAATRQELPPQAPQSRRAFGALFGLGLVAAPLYAIALRLPERPFLFTALFTALCALYAASCRLVLHHNGARLPVREALPVIVLFALAYRLILVPAEPWLSDDFFRYVWDGFIQGEGYSPYHYPPRAAELEGLRDDYYWPRVNRKEQTSAYPPFAELAFRLLFGVKPFSTVAFKLGFLTIDLATIGLLYLLLRDRGQSPLGLIVYAWHPLPPFEFFGNAHIDVLAVLLLVLALLLQARGHPLGAGVALGLATLTKLYPGLLLPAFTRRGHWHLPLAWLATVVAGFAPALLAGDTNFRQFPTYVREEGYDSGERYFPLLLLRLIAPVPAAAYVVAVAIVLLALSLRLYLRPGAFDVPRRALWLAATIMLLVTPAYPWYFTWLLPLLALVPVPGLLFLTGVAALIYLGWGWFLPQQISPKPLVAFQYCSTWALLLYDRRRSSRRSSVDSRQ